ncbi:MAG TPA: ATP-binding protein [Bacteroidia bacterium]|nr:ATP-binding protein [Bacteroidia bacterium]
MWTEEKLNQYITDKIEENLHLDYKAADALSSSEGKKNEISKDISAFANSDGGTIIYGIKEFQSDQNYLPEKIDPVRRNIFSKETLEQIINSRISPRIHGIVISSITIGQESDNNVVYVVEIPKGTTAHQAYDKRYYRRFNFLSVSMDDWEIKDIINRQSKAIIEISFEPTGYIPKKFLENLFPGGKLDFDIHASNIGMKVVEYCDCIIEGNKEVSSLIIPNPDINSRSKHFELYYTNEVERQITHEDVDYTINIQRMPILPYTYRGIGCITFCTDFFLEDHVLIIIVSLDDNRIFKKITSKELLNDIILNLK